MRPSKILTREIVSSVSNVVYDVSSEKEYFILSWTGATKMWAAEDGRAFVPFINIQEALRLSTQDEVDGHKEVIAVMEDWDSIDEIVSAVLMEASKAAKPVTNLTEAVSHMNVNDVPFWRELSEREIPWISGYTLAIPEPNYLGFVVTEKIVKDNENESETSKIGVIIHGANLMARIVTP